MRKLLEFLRVLIISPEALFLSIIGAIAYSWPHLFVVIGNKFASDEKPWEYISYIPIGVSIYVVKDLLSKVQSPVESVNREFYDWDLYWALKLRIYFCVFWCVLASIFSIVILGGGKDLPPFIIGYLFISSFVLSVVVSLAVLFASWDLKEILSK